MKKYLTFLKTSLKDVVAEKATVFVWSFSGAIGMIGILAVWLATDQQVIGGYTRPQLISYYLLIFILSPIVTWNVFWGISSQISDGDLSNLLLKPFSFISYHFLHEFAYKIVNLITQLIVGFFLVVLLSQYIDLSLTPETIIKIIPTIFIAIGINFFISTTIGCLTFFWTDSNFAEDLVYIIIFIFAGTTFPLSFFPSSVQTLVNINPFRFTLSFTIENLFGRLDQFEYLKGLLVGIIWLIIFFTITKLLWEFGLKKYSSFGH